MDALCHFRGFATRSRILPQACLVALVGFDDISEADLLTPAITLVTQDVATMGESAAELLFKRLNGYEGEFEKKVIPTVLTPRGSGEIAPTQPLR